VPEEPGFLGDVPPPAVDPEAPAGAPGSLRALETPAPGEPSAGSAIAPEPALAGAEALAAKILARLNPEQARAVTMTDGPLLILAGAGSGKTRVLAHRVAYLIGVRGVRPWQILAVTFTNRAAGELRERIIGLVGEPGRDVQAGTFHSICARVLRRDGAAIGINPRFVIYDTDDQGTLMKQILKAQDLPATGEFRPSIILGAISRAKNDMVDPTTLDVTAANRHDRMVAQLARLYHGSSRSRRRPCGDTRTAGDTCMSTNTRTPTARNTCG